MAKSNVISLKMSEEDLTAINGALTTLNEKLLPYLIALTAAEKKGLVKMRDKTTPFVEKAVDYAEGNSSLVPAYVDVAEMRTDFDAVSTLINIYRRVEAYMGPLDDTILLSGSEAYKAALQFYNAVKQAAKAGVPGAQAIYDDLKQRFEKSSSSESSAETETE